MIQITVELPLLGGKLFTFFLIKARKENSFQTERYSKTSVFAD